MSSRVGLLIVVLLGAAALACSRSSDVDAPFTDSTVFLEERRWLTPDAPGFASITSSASPGGEVEVTLRAGESRSLAYSLQPVSGDGGPGAVEWMVLVGEEGEGRPVSVERFTEIEPLGVHGPRTDRLRLPDEIAPGRWRVCIAFTAEPRCSEFTVGS